MGNIELNAQAQMLMYLGYSINIMTYIYLLNVFLKMKYCRIKTYAICFILNNIMIAIIINYFLYAPLTKLLCVFIYLSICVSAFFTDTTLKKIITPFLILATGLICEIPVDFILFYILKIDPTYIYGDWIFLVVQTFTNLLVLILTKFVFHNICAHFIFHKKSYTIICIVSLQLFTSVTTISQIQMMNYFSIPLSIRAVYILVMGIVTILCSIAILKYFQIMHQKIKLRMTMTIIQEEYKLISENYDSINNDFYHYLRHDIMNYLVLQKGALSNETNN